jgi:Uma2 family endonuclease
MADNGIKAAMNLVLSIPGVFKQARIRVEPALTDLELMALSEQAQGCQVEWLGKERMLLMSPTGSNSGFVSGILYSQVLDWSLHRGNGRAYPPDVGFRLLDGSILSPDVAWVSRAQLASGRREERDGFLPLCPEFIIEVKSPSDTLGYLRKKCRRWLAAGAKAVLLVDPEKRNSEIFLPDGTHAPSADGQRDIPGFEGLTLNLAAAWEDHPARG